MKISSQKIKEIAEELEAGMKVYINRENLEIRTILDWDDMYDNKDFWDEELGKIEDEWEDYIVIEKMDSREGFQIMEDFADEIPDRYFREDLIKILSRKSPFANFKAEVESSKYRQDWFDFRLRKYMEYVKDQLEIEGIEIEDMQIP